MPGTPDPAARCCSSVSGSSRSCQPPTCIVAAGRAARSSAVISSPVTASGPSSTIRRHDGRCAPSARGRSTTGRWRRIPGRSRKTSAARPSRLVRASPRSSHQDACSASRRIPPPPNLVRASDMDGPSDTTARTAAGRSTAIAHAVKPEYEPPYATTRPSLHGWSVIQSTSAAPSARSPTYGVHVPPESWRPRTSCTTYARPRARQARPSSRWRERPYGVRVTTHGTRGPPSDPASAGTCASCTSTVPSDARSGTAKAGAPVTGRP
ncbi:hypothetical protein BFL35_09495 [Clavibacter michiganensis]|nr:hypothetical protein BFL35_09495 [Clavibacter michiganensis]